MNALVIGYGSIGKRHCRLLLSMGVETHNIFVAELQKTRVGEAQEAGHKIFNIGADTSKQFDIVVRLPDFVAFDYNKVNCSFFFHLHAIAYLFVENLTEFV